MDNKFKVIVSNKKIPNGVVSIFGNVQNKVGTYDKDKMEQFKKKLLEISMEIGDRILFLFDEADYAFDIVTDKLFDKLIDEFVNHRNKKSINENNSLEKDNAYRTFIDEDKSFDGDFVVTRKINFEDLEPLGQIIDEEDDIYELQELKRELLYDEQSDEYYKENGGIIKK